MDVSEVFREVLGQSEQNCHTTVRGLFYECDRARQANRRQGGLRSAYKLTVMDIFRLMNDIDGLDLSANELAVLFKIITRLNRNYWKPVRINQKDATGRMHKETFFTVRKAISEQGLILYLPGKWKTDAPRV